MTALEAAWQVLADEGQPLHYREITQRMLDGGLWQTQGKTPHHTVNANLAVDIKEQGGASRFQRTAKGVFALRAWGVPEYVPPPPKGKPSAGGQPQEEVSEEPATLTFVDAAEAVLESQSDHKPMHYRAITDEILARGLVHTKGQTPEATLYAAILNEIKRNQRRGETPRFVMHGKGVVGLRKWMGKGLAFQIGRHNREVRRRLLARVRAMSWDEFEDLAAQLLGAMGFEELAMTPRGGDKGIDVRGTLVVGDVVRMRMAVQVKKWKANIQAPVVQQVRGSLGAHEQGLIITTSGFSKGAREEAARADATPVALMNGEQLVGLMIEYDIGVQRTSYDLIDLGEDKEVV